MFGFDPNYLLLQLHNPLRQPQRFLTLINIHILPFLTLTFLPYPFLLSNKVPTLITFLQLFNFFNYRLYNIFSIFSTGNLLILIIIHIMIVMEVWLIFFKLCQSWYVLFVLLHEGEVWLEEILVLFYLWLKLLLHFLNYINMQMHAYRNTLK